MRGIVGYFGVVLVTLAVAAAATLKFGYFLVGFELLLIGAAWLDGVYLRKKLRCYVSLPKEQAEKGEDFAVDVVLENGGLLPMTEISVELVARDTFTGKRVGLIGIATLDGRETARLRFTLNGEHCGSWDVTLGRVTLADHLGLLRQKLPRQEQTERLFILPESLEKKAVEGGNDSSSTEEGTDSSLWRKSDEGSDYELRAFQQGDGLKRIHWKMAAKTDELMVRSFEQPEQMQRTLILEPVPAEGETVTRETWDRYLEELERISGGLLHQFGRYFVVWNEKKRGIARRISVEDESSRRWMLCSVVAVPDEDDLGFGAWEEDGLEQKTEQETLCLRWGDVA